MNAHITAGLGSRGQHTYDEIVQISRATLAQHGHPGHAPGGGYQAKKDMDLLAKSHMPNTYPEELKTPYSDATLDRMNSGNEFEDYIGNIFAQHAVPGEVVVIGEERTADGERTAEGKAKKEEDTWAAYRDPKVRLIFNARMAGRFEELVSEYFGTPTVDPDRVSEPDAIEMGPMMPNGLRAMRFIDVKWHKVCEGQSAPKTYDVSELDNPFFDAAVHDGLALPGNLQYVDWMQLAHYYRHGYTLGLCDNDASLWGAVIGREEKVVWARIDEARYQRDDGTGNSSRKSALAIYDRLFALSIDVIDNAIARDLDPSVPALTYPQWSGDIADSEWAEVSKRELLEHGECGHITLLPGMTPPRARYYYQAGITGIGELARLPLGTVIDGVRDADPAILQARVSYYNEIVTHRDLEVWEMPRADIEVDYDYEADHVLYQRGFLVTDRTTGEQATEVIDDFTGSDEGEAEIFAAMWRRFEELTRDAHDRGLSICFYHFSHYERTQDKRLAVKHEDVDGVPSLASVLAFYDSPNVVDLFPLMSKQLMWPTEAHTVKALAKHLGFKWPEEGQNGAESMIWYRRALNGDDVTREENVARLRGYNGADVMAQYVLREQISQRYDTGQLRSAVNLPAPPSPEDQAA